MCCQPICWLIDILIDKVIINKHIKSVGIKTARNEQIKQEMITDVASKEVVHRLQRASL